jgi:L-serine dehydratase
MAINQYGIFDILGPIMIGPSSSHTAGAARLGKVAKGIVGVEFDSVKFYLHGSFAKTYKGHGTDRALVAGILGMDPGDEKLRYSMDIAKEKGIDIEFIEADLGSFQHPNTVKIVFETKGGREVDITGSSIGGGSIIITNIEGTDVSLTGNRPTLVVKHKMVPGVVTKVTKVLSEDNITVDVMKVERSTNRDESVMIIEVESNIGPNVLKDITEVEGVTVTRAINPL